MNYVVGAVLGLAFVALGLFGATLGGRYFGARALGVPGLGFFDARAADAYFGAPRWRRWLARLFGPVAAYVFPCALYFVALFGGGRTEATTEVDPLPGSPAAASGIERGDRIVAVDGRPTARWADVPDAIRNSPDAVLDLRVERRGRSHDVRVTRSPARTIGIAPRTREVDLSFGEAVHAALARPLVVMRDWFNGVFGRVTGEPVTLVGPVAVVREVEQSSRHPWREHFTLLGLFATLLWPGSLGIEFVMTPRRHASKAEAPPKLPT